MSIHVLPVDAERDYPRLADLINTVRPGYVTAELLHAWDENAPRGRIRWRVVAVTEGGRVVGFGDTGRDPHLPAGQYWLNVIVDPASRGQGIGAMLYEDVASFAWELGATSLLSDVVESSPEGRRFLEARGFAVEQHVSGGVWSLTCADEDRVEAALEAAETASVRLRALAGEHDVFGGTVAAVAVSGTGNGSGHHLAASRLERTEIVRNAVTRANDAYRALALALDQLTPRTVVLVTPGVYRMVRTMG